ncbi:hypothetical protein GUITHDRAFT_146936 [Guillardia theta CCMP2712]|uniref:Uncharacterized protein n=1 Tax=Guillardia theta (strain CCMP2712) TaxID=905079 RepID=L1IF05_GUITC|nr:hypothetical protein GUITHDRAFT_146936 [Guillardia theta CCMP2712]EKX34826.1 hypothetical protein GUITHDRAFT_146936 [Guillardia theta CCMP2712]|eukprot:XP_005821806.1 hypothetical protein GUITHDRAFT_146936 [Guillardia theta CCMP2712]
MDINDLLNKPVTMKLTKDHIFTIKSSTFPDLLPDIFFRKAIEDGSFALLREKQLFISDEGCSIPVVTVNGIEFHIIEFHIFVKEDKGTEPEPREFEDKIASLVISAMQQRWAMKGTRRQSTLETYKALRIMSNIFNSLCIDTPLQCKIDNLARRRRMITSHTDKTLLTQDGKYYMRFVGSNERVLGIKLRSLRDAKRRSEEKRIARRQGVEIPKRRKTNDPAPPLPPVRFESPETMQAPDTWFPVVWNLQ